jgi:hypothetical protein
MVTLSPFAFLISNSVPEAVITVPACVPIFGTALVATAWAPWTVALAVSKTVVSAAVSSVAINLRMQFSPFFFFCFNPDILLAAIADAVEGQHK